ncbi:MAG TPA: nucleoside triphosphate pyrophosphohydrolase [Candidatus Dormibacteraeota bacterium]|nr:nucleoside triphosphate pyrophosphohydrolase [Candidatus Dormibacteraeota bacterium]
MSQPFVERRAAPRCSFCGKSADQVALLVPAAAGGGRVWICDGCVALAQHDIEDSRPRISEKIRPTAAANVAALREMLEVIEALRAPDGCPWDREQTHASLRPYLLEETYEALEAIESGSPEDLAEELGDILLQVFMHHAIAQEAGAWSIADVARHTTAKMVNRHPHVFGDVVVDGPDGVMANWEGLKAREERKRGRVSALEGAPASLPALAWALSLQKRAARVGFDWPGVDGVLDKVAEEARELAAESSRDRQAEELGDLLFTLVNLARRLKVNPEDALRAASGRFRQRFERMEEAARAAGTDVREMAAAELDRLWEAAKADQPG